ncbi:MAG: hypothetical protein ACFNZZ_04045, partial [Veillonella parvula]
LLHLLRFLRHGYRKQLVILWAEYIHNLKGRTIIAYHLGLFGFINDNHGNVIKKTACQSTNGPLDAH